MTRAKNETPEQAERRKARVAAADRRRRETPAGRASIKAAIKRYEATEKGRASQKRRHESYRATEKGRATTQGYHATEKGRAAQQRYRATEKGRAAVTRSKVAEKARAKERQRKGRERARIERRWPVPKMPRLPLFRGTKRTRNAVEGERVEPFSWPGEMSGARAQAHFADWWSSIWQDVPTHQVVWGKGAGSAFRDYAKARIRRAVGVSRRRNRTTRRQRGR